VGGCASRMAYLDYDIQLVQVDRPARVIQQYGAKDSIELLGRNAYAYEDSLIVNGINFGYKTILLHFLNKTDQSMKVLWDEAGFIEVDNTVTKITHDGVKYIDRTNSMPATIVPKVGRLEDEAIPVDRIYFEDGYFSGDTYIPGEWKNSGIFPWAQALHENKDNPDNPEGAKAFLAKGQKYVGAKVGLLLPLEFDGVKNEYTFWFEVKGVSIDTLTSKKKK